MNGKNFLLAIAIDRYQHFSHLNNAVKDVEEIIDVLTSLYQFDKENVHKLFNEEATEDGIDDKFLELVDNIGDEDNLIIFYSGHGYYRESVREGYWIPVDGRKDKISDYISNANLIRYLQNIRAHHLFMIVDSCFSGALVEQLRGDPNSEQFPSRRVFASGRTELVSDGLPGENSPFAKGVIDFLKANREKATSTTAMIDSVRNYVGRVTRQSPVEGRLRDSKDNRGEFFFRRKLTEQDFWMATLAKDTLEAYQEYLNIYPEGDYSALANDHLKRHVARKAWNKAVQSNSPDDYEDFIDLYADSEFARQAKARLELLRKAEEARREAEEARIIRLREQKREEEEVERCRREYRQAALDAIKLMQEGNYRPARKKFWECEEFYRADKEGFIPDLEEIRAHREECTAQLLYAEHSEYGRNAFNRRDYLTAIQSFQKALEIVPGDEEIIRLRNAASSLSNAKARLEVPTGEPEGKKKVRIINRGRPAEGAQRPRVAVHRGQAAPARPKIRIQAGKGSKPKQKGAPGKKKTKPEGPAIITEPPDKKAKRDLTYLWVCLLILGYFISLKLFGLI